MSWLVYVNPQALIVPLERIPRNYVKASTAKKRPGIPPSGMTPPNSEVHSPWYFRNPGRWPFHTQ